LSADWAAVRARAGRGGRRSLLRSGRRALSDPAGRGWSARLRLDNSPELERTPPGRHRPACLSAHRSRRRRPRPPRRLAGRRPRRLEECPGRLSATTARPWRPVSLASSKRVAGARGPRDVEEHRVEHPSPPRRLGWVRRRALQHARVSREVVDRVGPVRGWQSPPNETCPLPFPATDPSASQADHHRRHQG
jgi:hypothetical protein